MSSWPPAWCRLAAVPARHAQHPTVWLFPVKATPCGCRSLPVAAALTGPLRQAASRVASLAGLTAPTRRPGLGAHNCIHGLLRQSVLHTLFEVADRQREHAQVACDRVVGEHALPFALPIGKILLIPLDTQSQAF